MALLIIGILAGAIAGGLVEYLLGLALPEKPGFRHLIAIAVFVLIFLGISVWATPEDNQTTDLMVALGGIQTREAELATAFVDFSAEDRSGDGGISATSEAYATAFAQLELTRVFLINEQDSPTTSVRPSQTPRALSTATATSKPISSLTPSPTSTKSASSTPRPVISTPAAPAPSSITNSCPSVPPELGIGNQRQVLGCELPCTAAYHSIFEQPTFPYSTAVADVAYPAVVQILGGPTCAAANGDDMMIFIKVQAEPGPGLFYSPQGSLYDRTAVGYMWVGGFQNSDPDGTLYWHALTK